MNKTLDKEVCMPWGVLDHFMPMNVILNGKYDLVHVGPTLLKLLDNSVGENRSFFDHFEFCMASNEVVKISEFALKQQVLRLSLINGSAKRLKANIVQLPSGQGYLLNFSLGVNTIKIIENAGLLAGDFAPTDSSIDMIYMLEVQQALLQESRRLTKQLYEDRKNARAKAGTDPLTGLANRRGLDAFLKRIMDRKTFRPFTLLALDLDHFKSINDVLGHAAGDFVLRAVALRLNKLTRPTDLVVRTGGDEFVIVLTDFENKKTAKSLSNRIIRDLEEPILYAEHPCEISVSIGASLVKGRTEIDHLIDHTDKALYHSKESGRGRVSFAKSIGKHATIE